MPVEITSLTLRFGPVLRKASRPLSAVGVARICQQVFGKQLAPVRARGLLDSAGPELLPLFTATLRLLNTGETRTSVALPEAPARAVLDFCRQHRLWSIDLLRSDATAREQFTGKLKEAFPVSVPVQALADAPRPEGLNPSEIKIGEINRRGLDGADLGWGLAVRNGVGRPVTLAEVFSGRKEALEKVDAFVRGEGDWFSIVGSAGVGKSALKWKTYKEYSGQGSGFQPVLLDAASNEMEGQTLVDTVAAAAEFYAAKGQELLVLLDNLDYAVSKGKTSDIAEAASKLRAKGVKIITFSRPDEWGMLERHYQSLGRAVPAQKLMEGLKPFSREEVEEAIRKYVAVYYGLDGEKDKAKIESYTRELVSNKLLVELGKTPLYLAMVFAIYTPQKIPGELSVKKIYDRFWREKVLSSRLLAGEESSLAEILEYKRRIVLCAAWAMADCGKLEITKEELALLIGSSREWRRALADLLSEGVLFETAQGMVRFFHQTFYEYAAAKALLSHGEDKTIKEEIDKLLDAESAYPVVEQLALSHEIRKGIRLYILNKLASHDSMFVKGLAIRIYTELEARDEKETLADEKSITDILIEDNIYLTRYLISQLPSMFIIRPRETLKILNSYVPTEYMKAVYDNYVKTNDEDGSKHGGLLDELVDFALGLLDMGPMRNDDAIMILDKAIEMEKNLNKPTKVGRGLKGSRELDAKPKTPEIIFAAINEGALDKLMSIAVGLLKSEILTDRWEALIIILAIKKGNVLGETRYLTLKNIVRYLNFLKETVLNCLFQLPLKPEVSKGGKIGLSPLSGLLPDTIKMAKADDLCNLALSEADHFYLLDDAQEARELEKFAVFRQAVAIKPDYKVPYYNAWTFLWFYMALKVRQMAADNKGDPLEAAVREEMGKKTLFAEIAEKSRLKPRAIAGAIRLIAESDLMKGEEIDSSRMDESAFLSLQHFVYPALVSLWSEYGFSNAETKGFIAAYLSGKLALWNLWRALRQDDKANLLYHFTPALDEKYIFDEYKKERAGRVTARNLRLLGVIKKPKLINPIKDESEEIPITSANALKDARGKKDREVLVEHDRVFARTAKIGKVSGPSIDTLLCSLLLDRYIYNNPQLAGKIRKVLEPCCGTGFMLSTAAKRLPAAELFIGTDVEPAAIEAAEGNAGKNLAGKGKIEIVKIDDPAHLNFGKWDLIMLNPPYVPVPPWEREAANYYGGTSVMGKIIDNLDGMLPPDGVMVMVYSNVAQKDLEGFLARNPHLRCEYLGSPDGERVPFDVGEVDQRWRTWLKDEHGLEISYEREADYWHKVRVMAIYRKGNSLIGADGKIFKSD